MKIVIDIPDRIYKLVRNKRLNIIDGKILEQALANGTPLPDGAEILTKEAYSDLCMRAADVTDTNVGDMDCIKDSTNDSSTTDSDSSTDSTTIEPKKCGDCISRIDMLKKLNNLCNNTCEYSKIQRKSMCDACNLDLVFDMINNAKAVEPEQKCRECASCKHSNNGECAYTEECHECMWESQYEQQVEPERKVGHWELDQRTGEYVCSECGCNPIYERTTPDVSEIDKYKYCRWCGAKMEVDG